MSVTTITKPAFTVIGIEGSTADGPDFIARLWETANARFPEIEPLCQRTADGGYAGFWGAMTDFTRAFRPWDNFSQGLYLAGAECTPDATPPSGWTKWIIPGCEYLRFDCEAYAFPDALAYLRDHGHTLAAAVHDFTDPSTGKSYMFFPIRRL